MLQPQWQLKLDWNNGKSYRNKTHIIKENQNDPSVMHQFVLLKPATTSLVV